MYTTPVVWKLPDLEGQVVIVTGDADRLGSQMSDALAKAEAHSAALKLSVDAVIDSSRHTFSTRLGEAGTHAFTIMRARVHSSVTVGRKYVTPATEPTERASKWLNAINEGALSGLPVESASEPAESRKLPAAVRHADSE